MAASGMRTRLDSLDMLANNIANASTVGYKADREFYNIYTAPEAAAGGIPSPPCRSLSDPIPICLKECSSHRESARPRTFRTGFFAAQSPGGPVYTRNGNFRRAADGTLVTSEGYPVGSADGKPIKMRGVHPVEISSDGTIKEDGKVIGQLQIVDFTSSAGLVKQGDNYFRLPIPA